MTISAIRVGSEPTGSGGFLYSPAGDGRDQSTLTHSFVRNGEAKRRVSGGVPSLETLRRGATTRCSMNTFLDNGAGIGARHRPRWSGLLAKLIQQAGVPGAPCSNRSVHLS